MFASLLLAAALVQPAPAAAPPPFNGIVAAGDFIVVTTRRDGVTAVRALSAAEAAALLDGQDRLVERAQERLREGLREFGVELSENPSREELYDALRDAGASARGGGVVVRGQGARSDRDEPRDRDQKLNDLQVALRMSAASRASQPLPVLAVSPEWLTYRTAGNEVTHLPLQQVGSLTESAARYAERTGTALLEIQPDEPAVGLEDDAE